MLNKHIKMFFNKFLRINNQYNNLINFISNSSRR